MNIPFKSYWQLLARYLRPRRLRVLVLAVLLFGSIALELINPQIIRFFIDTATSGRAEVFSTLLVAGIAYIGLAILHQSMRLAATYVGDGVAWDATNDLRADLALHLLKLDLGFHNARTPGELIERVDGDVGQLNTFFSQFALRLLSSIVMLVAVLALMWREDWRLGSPGPVCVQSAVVDRHLSDPAVTGTSRTRVLRHADGSVAFGSDPADGIGARVCGWVESGDCVAVGGAGRCLSALHLAVAAAAERDRADLEATGGEGTARLRR